MATVSKGRTFVSGETVTPAKLNELVDNATVTAIQTADISDSQITTAKIADANVTTAKIADSNVTAAKIASNAVETAKINNAAVTAAKLDGAQTGSAPIYGCRAWVNFDGTSVTNVGGENRCTIRGSGNVSKVVRASTGEYAVHFTTAMPDANYAAVVTGDAIIDNFGGRTTASFTFGQYSRADTLTRSNGSIMQVAVFG